MLRLYDTLRRRKERFVPIRRGRVSMYTCGPTVYDFAHIGNFRTYVFQDVLRRWLEYRGYKVRQVMNITDVDDKIFERARRKKVSAAKLGRYYARAFFDDARSLNISRAEVYPMASAHIGEMVSLTRALMRKGYAYMRGDSIFFDAKKAADYGALPRLKGPTAGRTKNEDYATKKDFALWLGERKGRTTKLGVGRPGWHVECPAMALRHIGPRMDVQSGGEDLIFPHHENGRVQAEAATGKTFVNYWLHIKHLYVDGRKMSKSLRNFYTLRDIVSTGRKPEELRLFYLMGAHYRKRLNFTFGGLERASMLLGRLRLVFEGFRKICKTGDCRTGKPLRPGRLLETAKSKFAMAMDDDLDTARALRAFFGTVSGLGRMLLGPRPVSQKDARKTCAFIMDTDRALGLLASS